MCTLFPPLICIDFSSTWEENVCGSMCCYFCYVSNKKWSKNEYCIFGLLAGQDCFLWHICTLWTHNICFCITYSEYGFSRYHNYFPIIENYSSKISLNRFCFCNICVVKYKKMHTLDFLSFSTRSQNKVTELKSTFYSSNRKQVWIIWVVLTYPV